jgi:multiple antibiotic resistance protein
MIPLTDFALLSFASLFVVVDPIGLLPAFVAMTGHHTAADKIRMAALASTITFCVLVFFAFTGQWFFNAFGVTLPAFEIAGGLVLLMIALDMLQARRTAVKETPEEQEEGLHKDDIAVTPLAIPLLAGPGAITTVILLSHRAATLGHDVVLIGNVFLVSLVSFLLLRLAAMRSALLSVIALKITARLMGLLLTSISVQFILNGIKEATHLW